MKKYYFIHFLRRSALGEDWKPDNNVIDIHPICWQVNEQERGDQWNGRTYKKLCSWQEIDEEMYRVYKNEIK